MQLTCRKQTPEVCLLPQWGGSTLSHAGAQDLVGLASIPNVVAVRPIMRLPMPEPLEHHVVSDPKDPAVFPNGQSTHYMTGVDKVHAQGFKGKGIKIGIIDTGIDYRHPALGGKFGPGNKVIGGYDLVGDYWYGDNFLEPDDDPLDTCRGHGTHVAGIMAADPGNEFNVSGVAYEASLLAYRVFSCSSGSTTDEIIVDAMIRAYNDGADIITLSLGSADGWSSSTGSIVATRLSERGRVITIAAGNDGEQGVFFPSQPATGTGAISVASVQKWAACSPATCVQMLTSMPSIVTSYLALTSSAEHAPIVRLHFSSDATDTACDWLPPEIKDLSKVAVIVRAATACSVVRIPCPYSCRRGMGILEHDQPEKRGGWHLRWYPTRAFRWLYDYRSQLVKEFAKGNPVTVTLPKNGGAVDVPNKDDGGLTSWFSSLGPTNELLFKPAVAAPGGNITSTWLTGRGSWAMLPGTSMATPYLAGCAAIYLQAKGKRSAKNVRAALQTTSRGLPSSKEKGALPQTLAHQGAGLVNLYNALNTKTEVTPSELVLNDTSHWKSLHSFTIKNTGKKIQTYKITHQPAGTTVSIPEGSVDFGVGTVPLVNAPAGVSLGLPRVTILPGFSLTVLVSITPPKKLNPKTLPIVSGWINIEGSLGDNVKVSYLGVAGSLRDAQTISTGNNILVANDGGLPALLPLDKFELYAQNGSVHLVCRMAQGSRRLVIDLIDAKSTIKSTIPDPLDRRISKRGFWSWWWPGIFQPSPGGSFAKVETLGLIGEYTDVTRGGTVTQGTPFELMDFPTTFANGTSIPDGQYKLLLRVLRIGGNPNDEKDYDVYVSQQVGLIEG
ncbi:subtilisin-like protein [Auricularia subglabra TFB-10046 SS5]|nr:subtilisin-like protein [Auricularia subglabra TFB-10046 SS5]